MQLNTLSNWLRFFVEEDSSFEFKEWTIRMHSFSDDKASLVFEKFEEKSPSHPPLLTKYIIGTDQHPTKLMACILFLAEQDFDLEKILSSLENMSLEESDSVSIGHLGNFNIAVMKFGE